MDFFSFLLFSLVFYYESIISFIPTSYRPWTHALIILISNTVSHTLTVNLCGVSASLCTMLYYLSVFFTMYIYPVLFSNVCTTRHDKLLVSITYLANKWLLFYICFPCFKGFSRFSVLLLCFFLPFNF